MNKHSVALAATLAALSGCASVTDGTTQTVVFQLSPKETRCVVAREGAQLGNDDTTQRLISKTQTSGVVGGFFLDLGITDMMTGAMWKYPNEISIVLEKSTRS